MQSFQGDIANSFHYGLSIDRDVIGYYGIGDSHVNFAMLEVIGPNAEGLAADAANVRFFSRVKCGVDLFNKESAHLFVYFLSNSS